ncbi:perlucin-like [Watersipora subatra]|uniref:perlucin-like n=1 Tax=Watersipora subatra TaxID=2589382 RepID=UPI00355C5C61
MSAVITLLKSYTLLFLLQLCLAIQLQDNKPFEREIHPSKPLREVKEKRSISKRELISSVPFGDFPYGNLCEICQKKETAVNCPPTYIRNPHSNTCMRMIFLMKTWKDAKYFCEVNGEHLATFDTLESSFWLAGQRKINAGWSGESIWLGGKRTNGLWHWTGKSTELIDTVPWCLSEPNNQGGNEDCLVSECSDRCNCQLNDYACDAPLWFACEKVVSP